MYWIYSILLLAIVSVTSVFLAYNWNTPLRTAGKNLLKTAAFLAVLGCIFLAGFSLFLWLFATYIAPRLMA